jgi:hypothetical protein
MSYMTDQKATALIRDMIDEVIENTNPEGSFAFEQYMDVKPMTRAEEVTFDFGGFGLPEEREILEDADFDEPVFGNKLTFVPTSYGRAFRVAKETIRDLADSGPHDGVNAARLGSYADYTARLKRQGWERADLECALKLVNGTSTATKYVGRRSEALFATNHANLDNPQLSQSNLTTGAAFNATNLQTALTTLMTQRDDRGNYISAGNDFLVIVPPTYHWKAIEILKTAGQVDSANNNVNPLLKAGLKLDSITVPNLDRANGSTYTGWFVQDRKGHGLRFRWREKPQFDKAVDLIANAIQYAMFMRAGHYHATWYGIVGFPPS